VKKTRARSASSILSERRCRRVFVSSSAVIAPKSSYVNGRNAIHFTELVCEKDALDRLNRDSSSAFQTPQLFFRHVLTLAVFMSFVTHYRSLLFS
jgi:hypothetical protein